MELEEQEISFDEITSVIKKRWKYILIPSLVAAILIGGLTYLFPRKYESYSLIRIGSVGGSPIESVTSIKDIMQSLPMRQQIAERLNEKDNIKFIKALLLSVDYSDEGGLLKIKSGSDSPEKAAKTSRTISEMVISRHEIMYLSAQDELDKVIKYVKKTINPIPLSSGISEFKISKTEIMAPAIEDKEPLPTKRRQTVIAVFFAVLLIMTIISFTLEGRKK
jgi:uncharacterized protein involved in exopolysaccharide biosynthesis